MNKMQHTTQEPIAAVATALSPCALGIVRCSGEGCLDLIAKIFSRPTALLAAKGNTIVYGWLESGKKRIDQVLISVFKAPHSYTGQDMAEVTCHGGVFVVQAVLDLLLDNGFRLADKGEFTLRAFVQGKVDLTKAEAVKEMIDTKTDLARQNAISRLQGDLFSLIEQQKQKLVETFSSIEAAVEYPEDENAISSDFDDAPLKQVLESLENLSSSWMEQRLLQEGVRIVLCGKTNVGKSSLFNAILAKDRAIVCDIAGTTRDWLEGYTSFQGIPVTLFDTAGLRLSNDVIEKKGIENTKNLAKECDLIFYVIDSTQGICTEDKDFIIDATNGDADDTLTAKSKPIVLLLNKCDKQECKKQEDILKDIPKQGKEKIQGVIFVSAKTRQGISELMSITKKIFLVETSAEQNDTGKASIGTQRQKQAIDKSLCCIRHALEAQNEFSLDALTFDIEEAISFLGQVTGEVTTDDVLDNVFSKFCLGK